MHAWSVVGQFAKLGNLVPSLGRITEGMLLEQVFSVVHYCRVDIGRDAVRPLSPICALVLVDLPIDRVVVVRFLYADLLVLYVVVEREDQFRFCVSYGHLASEADHVIRAGSFFQFLPPLDQLVWPPVDLDTHVRVFFPEAGNHRLYWKLVPWTFQGNMSQRYGIWQSRRSFGLFCRFKPLICGD